MNRLILLIALGVFSVNSLAQNLRDMEQKSSDDELNRIYKQLTQKLSKQDKEKLVKAQRAWISFRDLDCAYGWAIPSDCITARTDERIQQLKDSVLFDANTKQIQLK
jgi:uncharacterized protein YecT (DUF1311 family)